MKKVLFVIPSLGIGGAEKSLIELLPCFDGKEYRIDLLCLGSRGVLAEQVPAFVNFIDSPWELERILTNVKISSKLLIKDKKLGLLLKRLLISLINRIKHGSGIAQLQWKWFERTIPINSEEYDVAVAYLQGVSEYYVIDKIRSRHKILWMHTSFLAHSERNKFETRYILSYDNIVCVSEAAKEDFVRIFPEMKDCSCVVKNRIDREKIIEMSKEDSQVKFDDGYFNIVSVGRLHPAKGYDLTLKAMEIIKSKYENIRLYIIGSGELYDDLNKTIINNSLSDSCFLLGAMTNPYVYMSKADLIVQASKYEGFCIVLAEAKTLFKPIVSTRFFGAEEQLVDGYNGLIVDTDAESIAQGIIRMYENKNLRYNLIKNLKNEIQEMDTSAIDVIEKYLRDD